MQMMIPPTKKENLRTVISMEKAAGLKGFIINEKKTKYMEIGTKSRPAGKSSCGRCQEYEF